MSGLIIQNMAKRLVFVFCSAAFSSWCFAQSTPSEFAEMSLQDLFSISTEDTHIDQSPWSWSVQYRFAEFDGYLQGDDSLTLDEVLFVPGTEARSDSNFPVVPTVITQEVTLLALSYEWSSDWHLNLALPYIKQATDHISIVPGYDEFLIESSGAGDVTLSANHRIVTQPHHHWWFSLGVNFPTGSIDEKGDTPRAPGDQQLPYTMQLGSGTYDIPLELQYHHVGELDLSLRFAATIRTGRNDRDYRLGNRYSISGRYGHELNENLAVFVASEFSYIDVIQGADQSLLVPQPVPYPASITNPNLYGGRKLLARLGASWQVFDDHRLTFEFAKPIYQHLNGPQPKERWRSGVMFSGRL